MACRIYFDVLTNDAARLRYKISCVDMDVMNILLLELVWVLICSLNHNEPFF